jgi:hypothetical protein
MTDNMLATTVGAFEKRMMLRRRMLAISGVSLPKGDLCDALYAANRKNIIDCYECPHDEECEIWLNGHQTRHDPPKFCNARLSIFHMRILMNISMKNHRRSTAHTSKAKPTFCIFNILAEPHEVMVDNRRQMIPKCEEDTR